MRRFVAYGPAFVVLLAVLTALLVVPTAIRRIGEAQTTARVTLARHTLEDDDILERLNRASRAIAASVQPSVVHIDVDLPGKFAMRRSTGSGWVYDAQGHIITNAHVIRGARDITVQFSAAARPRRSCSRRTRSRTSRCCG
jgi:S1-C subfamily serine protease